jgi:hypothetical protein
VNTANYNTLLSVITIKKKLMPYRTEIMSLQQSMGSARFRRKLIVEYAKQRRIAKIPSSVPLHLPSGELTKYLHQKSTQDALLRRSLREMLGRGRSRGRGRGRAGSSGSTNQLDTTMSETDKLLLGTVEAYTLDDSALRQFLSEVTLLKEHGSETLSTDNLAAATSARAKMLNQVSAFSCPSSTQYENRALRIVRNERATRKQVVSAMRLSTTIANAKYETSRDALDDFKALLSLQNRQVNTRCFKDISEVINNTEASTKESIRKARHGLVEAGYAVNDWTLLSTPNRAKNQNKKQRKKKEKSSLKELLRKHKGKIAVGTGGLLLGGIAAITLASKNMDNNATALNSKKQMSAVKTKFELAEQVENY